MGRYDCIHQFTLFHRILNTWQGIRWQNRGIVLSGIFGTIPYLYIMLKSPSDNIIALLNEALH
jgi:hypothetical protein